MKDFSSGTGRNDMDTRRLVQNGPYYSNILSNGLDTNTR